LANLTYVQYSLFFLIGFIFGRLSMAIQYSLFKEMAFSKRKKEDKEENNLMIK
jgi:hypothetical protein